ncbi:hypothetical protein POTOM_021745 [Populus tomentosa]|uniref:Retroviral polymerase SH3-like domain-containing protein n=1 Tax=Populus tomentosa TaxID=118781 RepID=A0A8X7ZUE7_POPTO|nr:hypothetical protein POTOM_021745 [Populus tomentosa]
MRLHSGLPQTFWADAVHTAVYLINHGPSVPLEFRLPKEVWRGKEVQLSHLKVFGCVFYVHIDFDARNKLEAKSKKCFFIGYGDEEFGFRFWDDQNRKIIRSRNVIFNEKVMYKDRSSGETEMVDSDTSSQRFEFIRLEGLPDVTKQNKNQESLQEDSSTSVPTTTQEDTEPIEPAIRRQGPFRSNIQHVLFTTLREFLKFHPFTWEILKARRVNRCITGHSKDTKETPLSHGSRNSIGSSSCEFEALKFACSSVLLSLCIDAGQALHGHLENECRLYQLRAAIFHEARVVCLCQMVQKVLSSSALNETF